MKHASKAPIRLDFEIRCRPTLARAYWRGFKRPLGRMLVAPQFIQAVPELNFGGEVGAPLLDWVIMIWSGKGFQVLEYISKQYWHVILIFVI